MRHASEAWATRSSDRSPRRRPAGYARRVATAWKILAAIVLTIGLAGRSGAQGPGRSTQPAPEAGRSPTVARVGELRIAYDELDDHDRQAQQLYRDRNGTDMAPELRPYVRRQVLENLIRQRLLALEARRQGVTVSDEEAEAQLRLDPVFRQNGMFNEARYLALKAANPAGYEEALAAHKVAIAARKAGDRMDRETQPDDAAIRTELGRELMVASIEYLALRWRDFDGAYPEPREQDVLAQYREHAERYRRPEEATVDVVLFNRPAPTDSMGASDVTYRAWEERMRARADSALAAIRGGASFEALAFRNGGVKTLTLLRDRQPVPWRGGPREVAAVFGAAPGTILPEPVRSTPGWALVRVRAVTPSQIAALPLVAREIRAELRARARSFADEAFLNEIYESSRDTLRGEGYRIRYALADTGSFRPKEPTGQELERYYRAHLVDYSSYDRATGTIVETPFAQVREDLRRRWIQERRRDVAQQAAERLADIWGRGKRDRAIENAMTLVRETRLVPAVGEADTGRAGRAVGEALAAVAGALGLHVIPVDGGFVVLEVQERLTDYVPTLAQSRSRLLPAVQARREADLERIARSRYESDSTSYRSRAVVHFSRLLVAPPDPMDVHLSRDEVERFYKANLNKYSIEELVRVRHILVATTGRGALPDGAARARAESLLTRVRAGEDFARLAEEYSDDVATKFNGGDVGTFRHGMMREAFERAAFAMRPGDIAGPIRTEVGYHVLECLEYAPPIFHPLSQIYGNVAFDCALRKAKRISKERADSLYRSLRSVSQAKKVAEQHGFEIILSDHEVGRTGRFSDALLPYILKIQSLKPGVLYPGVQEYEGMGTVISWVDHVTPPRRLRWEEVRETAIDQARTDRLANVLRDKRAELDSLQAAGWTFDSLLALWGGPERLEEVPMGTPLGDMGGAALLDSLVFGGRNPPVLETGRVSDWLEFAGGWARLRVADRYEPDPQEFVRRFEQRRQVVLWRNLKEYFDRLKNRYPVEILDPELRETALLEPTES